MFTDRKLKYNKFRKWTVVILAVQDVPYCYESRSTILSLPQIEIFQSS